MIKCLLFGCLCAGALSTHAVETISTTCQELTISESGGFTVWKDICRSVSLSIPEGAGELLAALPDLELIDQSALNVAAGEAMKTFHYHNGITIIRHLVLDETNGFTEVVKVENRGDAIVTRTPILLDLATRPRSQPESDFTIGSYLYDFSWLFGASDSEFATHFVFYTRHVAAELSLHSATIGREVIRGSDDEIEGVRLSVPALSPGDHAEMHIFTKFVPTTVAEMQNAEIDGILFQTTWKPIRFVSVGIERLLITMVGALGSPGLAIILFALLVRFLTLRLNRWAARQQTVFSEAQAAMSPLIAEARQNLRGAPRSERILEIYKDHHISPLSGLKPIAPLLIQLPILIAFFGVTTESDLFRMSEFLWIRDLSSPDQLFTVSLHIPFLGAALNLLPVLLGVIGCASVYLFPQDGRSGLWLNLLFTLLFYTLASALVIYWISVNLSQLIERYIAGRGQQQS